MCVYEMGNLRIVDLTSHLGTHCECPYHHSDDWPSVAELPLTNFLGRGVYLDFGEMVLPGSHSTAEDLEQAAKGRVQEGDVVIIDSAYFLPLMVAVSASKRLKVNSFVALSVVGALLSGLSIGFTVV